MSEKRNENQQKNWTGRGVASRRNVVKNAAKINENP
jgi:hypothetical protein